MTTAPEQDACGLVLNLLKSLNTSLSIHRNSVGRDAATSVLRGTIAGAHIEQPSAECKTASFYHSTGVEVFVRPLGQGHYQQQA